MRACVIILLACTSVAQGAAAIESLDQRSFSLELPEAAFSQEGSSLVIDLAGYDITAFSRIQEHALVVELESPLPSGEYLLSVLQISPDGDAAVLLDTVLRVVEQSGARHAVSGMLQTSYRVADGPGQALAGTDNSATKGSLSYEGLAVSGAWRLGAAFDVIYDRLSPAAPANERWLLPDYLVSATHAGPGATSSLRVGGVRIPQEDFLFSGFRRRGVSLETTDAAERLALQAFSVVSTPSNRLQGEQILPRENDNRASGIATSFSFWDGQLRLKGGVVDGRTGFGGAGFNNLEDTAVYGGESWNAGLQSTLIDGSLELSLERAGSRFDADGLGFGESARTDEAERATMVVSSAGRFASGPFSYWSLQLEHREVGIDFYSLGNMSLPGNLRVGSAYVQAGFRDFAFDVELARERSNPGNVASLPEQTFDRAGGNVAYTPGMLDLSSAPWRWLGTPSVNAWMYRLDSSQPDSDAMLAGFDLDNSTNDVGIGLAFARERLTWGLQLGVIDYKDRSVPVFDGEFLLYEPPSDSRNVQVSLQSAWVPTERVTLDAVVQHNTLDETGPNDVYRNMVYSVGASFMLLPEKLSARASINVGRDRNRFGNPLFLTERFRSRVADLQLSWQASPVRADRPGLRLTLSGSYARNEDLAAFVDNEFWYVLIGAQLDWKRARP